MLKKSYKLTIALVVLSLSLIPLLSFGFLETSKVEALSCSWTGGSNTWENSGSWTSCGGGVPGAADDVTIDANVTVDINATTTINSLTLGNGAGTTTPTLRFDYDAISSGALIVDDGNVTIHSNADVTHADATTSTIVGRVYIDVQTGSLTITGTINVDSKGYTGGTSGSTDGYGSGGGSSKGGTHGAGGGYGGEGGRGGEASVTGGVQYGSLIAPEDLGSGGGYGCCGLQNGGDGGGSVKLNVVGTTTVNGSITATGQTRSGRGGGGSGGAIYISTATLAGTGSITANGGGGGQGAGGGGRIAIFYSSTDTFYNDGAGSGTITVDYGSGSNAGVPGTTYLKDSTNNDIYIPTDNGSWNANDTTFSYRNLSIKGDIRFAAEDATLFSLTTSGTTTIADNLTIELRGSYTTGSNGVGVSLDLGGSVTIPSGTVLTANSFGYAGTNCGVDGDGPGGGLANTCNTGGGGGAYGGDGGRGGNTGTGGTAYGSSTAPVDLGSGGSGGCCGAEYGGAGAGAIKVLSSGTLTVSGSITANGTSRSTRGGGGAGGSILLLVDTLAGAGTIQALGGNGGSSSTGGGGGGRIAVEYITANSWSGNTLSTAVATTGGTGSHTNGSDGTVTLNQLATGYVTNLSGTLNSYLSSNWTTDMEIAGNAKAGSTEIGISDSSDNRIAEFTLKFDGNLDLTSVSGDQNEYKAFFHVTGGFSNIAGYDAANPSYTLYVPKGNGTQVAICPGVTSLNDVNPTCSSIAYYDADSSNVNVVSVSGTSYWKVSGLTSTGGFTVVSNITDTMTRLQVSTASDHEIEFTTASGIDASTDTITVEFDPDGQLFDLSSITLGDIDLEDDTVDVALAVSAAAGVWGVSINTTTDIITFTAPTDAGAGEVVDGSVLVIKIGTNANSGTNQITNPATVSSYEIEMRMTTASSEVGYIEVPIIDDDTVNVTGYIDTFITFDIDTSETDEDCDVAGGAAPCDSHGGSTDNIGYVIDLGEMNTSSVNDSGDTVIHADGISGEINSIFFDLSTNANSGAVVTVLGLNGYLDGPGASTIPDVADGSEVQITAGGGLYGINSYSGLVNTATTGSAVVHDDCDGDTGSDYYCDVPTTPTSIFTTNSAPIDSLRLEWEVGASPDAGDSTGTYTDQLTFIASATF